MYICVHVSALHCAELDAGRHCKHQTYTSSSEREVSVGEDPVLGTTGLGGTSRSSLTGLHESAK